MKYCQCRPSGAVRAATLLVVIQVEFCPEISPAREQHSRDRHSVPLQELAGVIRGEPDQEEHAPEGAPHYALWTER